MRWSKPFISCCCCSAVRDLSDGHVGHRKGPLLPSTDAIDQVSIIPCLFYFLSVLLSFGLGFSFEPFVFVYAVGSVLLLLSLGFCCAVLSFFLPPNPAGLLAFLYGSLRCLLIGQWTRPFAAEISWWFGQGTSPAKNRLCSCRSVVLPPFLIYRFFSMAVSHRCTHPYANTLAHNTLTQHKH